MIAVAMPHASYVFYITAFRDFKSGSTRMYKYDTPLMVDRYMMIEVRADYQF